jgi:LPXTG-site transpeptidase (sortase) family protein
MRRAARRKHFVDEAEAAAAAAMRADREMALGRAAPVFRPREAPEPLRASEGAARAKTPVKVQPAGKATNPVGAQRGPKVAAVAAAKAVSGGQAVPGAKSVTGGKSVTTVKAAGAAKPGVVAKAVTAEKPVPETQPGARAKVAARSAKSASARTAEPDAGAGVAPAVKSPPVGEAVAMPAVVPVGLPAPVATAPVSEAAEELSHDPVAAVIGGPPGASGALALRSPREQALRSTRPGLLYDTRFLLALFAAGLAIGGTGAWLLFSQSSGTSTPPALPGNGVALPGGFLLPLALGAAMVMALGLGLAVGHGRGRAAAALESERHPKGWRWLYDSRVLATLAALALAGYGFSLIAPPNASPDLREVPGEVNNAIQGAVAKPETGYPRLKLTRVAIDLLLVKGDGRTPPVKYEAFTYPGADHLLTGPTTGGSNTYVYGHARTGMFWRLHDLRIGDVVDVDYGSGRVLHYRVAEIHPNVDWKDFSWLQPTPDDRLTLQTCNGWKDDDPRFIVVARRVPDAIALAR